MSRGLDREVNDLRERSSSWNDRRAVGDHDDSRSGRTWLLRTRIRSLDRERIPLDRELPEHDARDFVRVHDEVYRLRQSEVDALQQVGRFRIVDENDLERFEYADDSTRMREDFRSLRAQGLIERHNIRTADNERLRIVTLTDRGREAAAEFSDPDSRQRYYSGFVKPSEAEHDAALYRMYQAEAAEIRQKGGAVRRVELDFELKREVYGQLGKAQGAAEDERRRVQHDVAARHGLRVVRGRIQIPDVRIEYETAQGSTARVSLELTTEHYRKGQIAAKAEAGFRLYSLGSNSSQGGSPVRDEREITVEIFSL